MVAKFITVVAGVLIIGVILFAVIMLVGPPLFIALIASLSGGTSTPAQPPTPATTPAPHVTPIDLPASYRGIFIVHYQAPRAPSVNTSPLPALGAGGLLLVPKTKAEYTFTVNTPGGRAEVAVLTLHEKKFPGECLTVYAAGVTGALAPLERHAATELMRYMTAHYPADFQVQPLTTPTAP